MTEVNDLLFITIIVYSHELTGRTIRRLLLSHSYTQTVFPPEGGSRHSATVYSAAAAGGSSHRNQFRRPQLDCQDNGIQAAVQAESERSGQRSMTIYQLRSSRVLRRLRRATTRISLHTGQQRQRYAYRL